MLQVVCFFVTGYFLATHSQGALVALQNAVRYNFALLSLEWFLPRDATQSAVMPQYIVCASVRDV